MYNLKYMTTNLMVENVDASVKFYTDVLCFQLLENLTEKNEEGALEFAIIKKTDRNLMLQSRESVARTYSTLTTDKVKPTVHIFIPIDNFEKLYTHVQDKAEIVVDKYVTSYGSTEFAIADPDGYVIVFADAEEW